MSVVEGMFNGHAFQAPLEPDGMGSHWFMVTQTMLEATRAAVGDSVPLRWSRWHRGRNPSYLRIWQQRLHLIRKPPVMDGHHARGALGLDSLDRLNQKP
jgi:hypothetical protein